MSNQILKPQTSNFNSNNKLNQTQIRKQKLKQVFESQIISKSSNKNAKARTMSNTQTKNQNKFPKLKETHRAITEQSNTQTSAQIQRKQQTQTKSNTQTKTQTSSQAFLFSMFELF